MDHGSSNQRKQTEMMFNVVVSIAVGITACFWRQRDDESYLEPMCIGLAAALMAFGIFSGADMIYGTQTTCNWQAPK